MDFHNPAAVFMGSEAADVGEVVMLREAMLQQNSKKAFLDIQRVCASLLSGFGESE